MSAAPDEVESPPPPRRSRGRKRWWLLVLFLLFGGVLVAHGMIGEWLLREAMARVAPRAGWDARADGVRVRFFEPVVLENLQLRSLEARQADVSFGAERVALTVNSLSEIFFGGGRVFARLDCTGGDLIWDGRKRDVGIRRGEVGGGKGERDEAAARRLRFLPETVAVRSGRIAVDGLYGLARLEQIDGAWSEVTASEVTVGRASGLIGDREFRRVGLRATTAWKDGVAYFSDLPWSDGVLARSVVVSLVNPDGPAVSLDLEIDGGSLRADVGWTAEAGLLRVDLALSAANLPLRAFAELGPAKEAVGGLVREGRLTFRGNPGRLMDSEIALRLDVEGLERRGERWDSLRVGANFIGRRLYVSTVQLEAGENRIVGNGEIRVPRGDGEWLNSDFLLNLSADVREIRKLAAFTGDWWGKMAGRLSLHGAISGEGGRLDGYANGEASGVTFRALPAMAMKFSAVVSDREVQVRSAELWSGDDRATAKGSINAGGSHRYTGDIAVAVGDVSRYTEKLGEALAGSLKSGGLTLTWQGDGTWNAHSGVFQAALTDAATAWTPAGITGQLEGSYSPENLYFSRLRLQNGPLDLNTRLTISSAGANLTDLELRRGKARLVTGEGFAPVNVFALLRGERLVEALDPGKPVYGRFVSRDLPLAEVVAMAGQDAVAKGDVSFRLEAAGPLPDLALTGELKGRGLSLETSRIRVPKTSLDLELSTADRRLSASGSVDSQGFEPMVVRASMPFVFEAADDGRVRFIDSATPISANVEVPSSSLEVLGAMIPGVRSASGKLAGGLKVAGTIGEPGFSGELRVSGGEFALADDLLPALKAVEARIVLAGSRVEVVDGKGKMGGGPASFVGTWDAAAKVPLEFSLRGEKVPCAVFGLRGNLGGELSGAGDWSAGVVSGDVEVELAGGPEYFDLRLGVDGKQSTAPAGKKSVKNGWSVAAKVTIPPKTKFAGGTLAGELALEGPVADPRLVGELAMADVAVKSASGWPLAASGRLFFRGPVGEVPRLVAGGVSRMAGRRVMVLASGSADDLSLWLRAPASDGRRSVAEILDTSATVEWPRASSGSESPMTPRENESWSARGQMSPAR